MAGKKLVAFFAPPPADLRRIECPACGGRTTLFCTPAHHSFAVDDDGVLHVLRCSLRGLECKDLHDLLHQRGTGYDSLLLLSAHRFRETLL